MLRKPGKVQQRWLAICISFVLIFTFCFPNMKVMAAGSFAGEPQNQTEATDVPPQIAQRIDELASMNEDSIQDQMLANADITTPYISISLSMDTIHAYNFGEGITVTLEIDDPSTGPGIDYTTSAKDWTSVTFYLHDIYPLMPGMIVTCTSVRATDTTVVRNLGITAIDRAANTFSGFADPGSEVLVSASATPAYYTYSVLAGADGTWNAQFSGFVEFGNDAGLWAKQVDPDGDSTSVGASINEPSIYVGLSDNMVSTTWWIGYRPVSITIDDPSNGPGVDYSATSESDEVGTLHFTPDTLTLAPGMLMTLWDMATTKTYVVEPIYITGVDFTSDTIFGMAPPGAQLGITLCDSSGCSTSAVADQSGFWSAMSYVDQIPGNVITAFMANETYTRTGFTLTLSPNENDDILSAIDITDVPSEFVIPTIGASQAPGDPALTQCGVNPGLASVWYKYSPAADRDITLDTFGSQYDTVIGVWSGSPASLTPVACNNDDGSSKQSKVSFAAVTGQDYFIGISLFDGLLSIAGAGSAAKESMLQPQSAWTPPAALTLHVSSFADVLSTSGYYRYVEGLYAQGITGGCATNPLRYCPLNAVTRAQMAVFLLKAEHGSTFVPPTATGLFGDVPANHWAGGWIEKLADEGITSGCSAGMYCPNKAVTRAQMAVFLLKAKYGKDYVPPAPTGVFGDVPVTHWAAAWIEKLAAEGITTGCSAGMYCPLNPVTRAQMAVFIDKTFGFPLVP